MGTKRKVTAITQLTSEPRRSRRNITGNDAESNDEAIKINGDEQNDLKSLKKTKLTKQTDDKQPATTTAANTKIAKKTAKAIIEEEIDFNKEIIPIRTYGKSDRQLADNKTTTRSGKLTGKIEINTISKVVNNNVDLIKPIETKEIKKTNEIVQKKKGSLTINSSPTNVTAKTNVDQQLKSTISTIQSGNQKKIIINKILFQSPNQPISISNQPQIQAKSPIILNSAPTGTITTHQIPVQNLINNLQTSLGPIVLGSNIKVIPNLTVTNPQSTVLTNSNISPQTNPTIRILTSTPKPQLIGTTTTTVTQPPKVQQIKVPIIIQSITSTNDKNNPVRKVNPISSVKAPIVKNNQEPERAVKKARVSFNFDKNNISTNIKPISNELPVTASKLMTSTPKQSIIKKPKVFDLPCTPIAHNMARRGYGRLANSIQNINTIKPPTQTIAIVTNNQQPISHVQPVPTVADQSKNKIDIVRTNSNNYSKTPQKAKLIALYCESGQCACWSNIPKDDLDRTKQIYQNLNAPKRQLFIYLTTIKLDDSEAKFDFEKFAFFVKTTEGYVQVCHRVYMDIFGKQNLSFVENAFKKCNL